MQLIQAFRHQLSSRPFHTHPMLFSGHLQTLASSQLPRKFDWGWTQSQERTLELENGVRISVDSVQQPQPAPTVIALHGMGGSARSIYMQALSHKAYREGWNCHLLNLYNVNLELNPPHIFHAGASEGIRSAIEQIAQLPTTESILLTGFSLGGNILLKLLGSCEMGFSEKVVAAAAVSPLVDLTTSWQILEKPANTIYRRHFVKGLKNILRLKSDYLRDFVDLDSLMEIRTIREFDELFTAPLGGFTNADDYYRKASSIQCLGDIRVPTLILHSRDDPLLPWEPLTVPEANANPALLIHLTKHGGHVAFLEWKRHDIDRSWAENRVIDLFRMAAGLL